MSSTLLNGGFIGQTVEYGDPTLLYSGYKTPSLASYFSRSWLGSSSNHVEAMPAGVQVGDLLLCGYSTSGTTNATLDIVGFNILADLYGNDTNDINLTVGWKIATIDDILGGVTFGPAQITTTGANGVLQVWRDIDIEFPIIDYQTSTVVNSRVPTCPDVGVSVPPYFSGTTQPGAFGTGYKIPIVAIAASAHTGGALDYSSSTGNLLLTSSYNSTYDNTIGADYTLLNISGGTGTTPAPQFSIATTTSDSAAAVSLSLMPMKTYTHYADTGVWDVSTVLESLSV